MYTTDSHYVVDLGNCLGFIEDSVDMRDQIVIVGDFNFPCATSHAGFVQCQSVFDMLDVAVITLLPRTIL